VDGANNIGTPTTHLLQGVPTSTTIAILNCQKNTSFEDCSNRWRLRLLGKIWPTSFQGQIKWLRGLWCAKPTELIKYMYIEGVCIQDCLDLFIYFGNKRCKVTSFVIELQ
jgi:hypothetical protein